MIRLSLKEIVKEIIRENVGPGPDDMSPVSQIYYDLYNQFLFPDSFPNFEEENYELYRHKERLKLGKNILDKEFNGDLENYRNWRKKQNLPKGRKIRKFNKPIDL